MSVNQNAVRANLKHITKFEVKPNVKPLPETAVTRGFEKVAYPKIVRELQDPNLIIRQKSLLAARELLAVSEGYVQCIAAGITPALVALLEDEDEIVRERAAGTLEYVAVKEVGCRDMIQHGAIPRLFVQLRDEYPTVRLSAYKCLKEACRFDCSRMALIFLETALPELMLHVVEEDDEMSVLGLSILVACVQVRHNEKALLQLIDDADAMPALRQLIESDQSLELQQVATQLIACLTATREDAKLQAVKVGCVPQLLTFLEQPDLVLARAAAVALSTISLANEGKFAITDANGAPLVAQLVDFEDEQVCLNLLQVMTNIAEYPKAREQLLANNIVGILQAIITNTTSSLVNRSAAQALRQANFKNWPYQPVPGAEQFRGEFPQS